MGNAESSEQEKTYGYRVLGVQASSPASAVGLVSFFDFIIEANGEALWNKEVSYFVDLIREFEDKKLPLKVYNCKDHSTRDVELIPTTNWVGEGRLGVAIRFDSFHDAEERLCRVLEIEQDSPAELAGLQQYSDYLLGTAEIGFSDTDVLFEELRVSVDRTVEFYVYNSDTDEVRVVVIMPNHQWGGEGLLGANVACGYLHRLPTSCCGTTGHSNEISLQPLLQQQQQQQQQQGESAQSAQVAAVQTPVKAERAEFGQSP